MRSLMRILVLICLFVPLHTRASDSITDCLVSGVSLLKNPTEILADPDAALQKFDLVYITKQVLGVRYSPSSSEIEEVKDILIAVLTDKKQGGIDADSITHDPTSDIINRSFRKASGTVKVTSTPVDGVKNFDVVFHPSNCGVLEIRIGEQLFSLIGKARAEFDRRKLATTDR